ncbi:diguanylate cyclase [Paenibacillus sp. P25]|nr:diguanylate cyclase [Paenibacillus sp. P25]
MLEQLFFFFNVYFKQNFSALEMVVSLSALLAFLFGFFIPFGISVVAVFIFLVTYLVWMTTFSHADVIVVSWFLVIPANVLIAAFIRKGLIRTKRINERLNDLKATNPQIDLDTALGNKEALADMLIKQSNLARRYSDQYGFSMAFFKIEFLSLVLESLGSELYAKFLIELSNTIQKQIRFEDSKFSIEGGRFIILCPMTNREYFPVVTERIKNALMDMPFLDKKGQPLKLVVRASSLEFNKDQFELYQNIDQVIALLERGTETDLVAEYV